MGACRMQGSCCGNRPLPADENQVRPERPDRRVRVPRRAPRAPRISRDQRRPGGGRGRSRAVQAAVDQRAVQARWCRGADRATSGRCGAAGRQADGQGAARAGKRARAGRSRDRASRTARRPRPCPIEVRSPRWMPHSKQASNRSFSRVVTLITSTAATGGAGKGRQRAAPGLGCGQAGSSGRSGRARPWGRAASATRAPIECAMTCNGRPGLRVHRAGDLGQRGARSARPADARARDRISRSSQARCQGPGCRPAPDGAAS